MDNYLGTKPIPGLLWRFALPSIVSQLVHSIYNMVDQVFIGQKIGYLGNAATNVTFPFVTFFLAVNLMISVGTAANIGLKLGAGHQEQADRTLGNSLTLAVITSLIMCVASQVFLVPLLTFFGATEAVLPYAVPYARIYTIGVLFVTPGILLGDIIRADGSPTFAMYGMLAGAICNVILDYLFIFPLNMGMQGAALASIIGQLLSLLICLTYLKRFRTLNLKSKNLRPEPGIIRSIFLLGFPMFATQIAGLVVQIVMNQQAVKYGALSPYGSEIPLTVFGIVMKINAIMMALILGTSIGAQPIFSFNYGAGNFARVKQLIRICLITTIVIGIAGTLVIQIFPLQIISIFGQEDALYNEFAVRALTRMTILLFLIGTQMTSTSYFQAVGKPGYSVLVSLFRQIIVMIPLFYLLPLFLGVDGIMYTFVLSDVASVILCTILLTRELRFLNSRIKVREESV